MDKEEKFEIQSGDKVPSKGIVESPHLAQKKDLREYKYFGKKFQTDSAGNSQILPDRLMIVDENGNTISMASDEIPIPVNSQEELSAFMAKAPYFDKDGVLQYGYKAPGPNAQEQAKVIYTQLKESAVNGLPVGLSPSPEAVSYAKDLQNIINPPVQKTTEAFVLASTSTETNSESAPVSNEVTLPTPPFPLSELNDFSSGWWS